DVSGWRSSYTGEPLGEEEMREWVERTVERVRSLGARRVLEVGCGTGLLTHRLAGECERYVGTDFARESLGGLRRGLVGRGGGGRAWSGAGGGVGGVGVEERG